MIPSRFAGLLPLLLAAGGCTPIGLSTADGGSGKSVTNHRASDAECVQAAPEGTCQCTASTCSNAAYGDGGYQPFQCVSDANCADGGVDGRCAASIGPAGCYCTYDACTGDSDCPSGQTCACHGSAYTFGGGSVCVPGNCRVDSDCGAKSACSPSPGGGCGSVSGYYCHTTSDTCTNDADCKDDTTACVYSTTKKHWSCVLQLGC